MFWYELKFLFPKNTNYWPKPKLNQNYEREREDFVIGNLKNTIPKHILKKPSTLNRIISKNKNPLRERERESTQKFFVGKIWIEWKKWYQIYTKQNEEKNGQNIRKRNG